MASATICFGSCIANLRRAAKLPRASLAQSQNPSLYRWPIPDAYKCLPESFPNDACRIEGQYDYYAGSFRRRHLFTMFGKIVDGPAEPLGQLYFWFPTIEYLFR